MADRIHVLLIRAATYLWALPMGNVEETFAMTDRRVHAVGATRCIVFRGNVVELHCLADAMGMQSSESDNDAALIVWAGGRRRAFAVEGLVGQLEIELTDLPPLTRNRFCTMAALLDTGDVVPLLDPSAVVGVEREGHSAIFDLDPMQRSALGEVANIGSGNAATALAQMLGRSVDITCPSVELVSAAAAADAIGRPTETWACVQTPVLGGGAVLLLFPHEAASRFAELLGTSIREEMGLSALREVGNILTGSYLTAIGEFTGRQMEPSTPEISIGMLGRVLEDGLMEIGGDSIATLLIHSGMDIVEAGFTFLYVPCEEHIAGILGALGLAMAA